MEEKPRIEDRGGAIDANAPDTDRRSCNLKCADRLDWRTGDCFLSYILPEPAGDPREWRIGCGDQTA